MAAGKWILGYAVVRSATRPVPPQREPGASGYPTFIGAAVVLTVLCLPLLWAFWPLTFLVFFWFVGFVTVWSIAAAGCVAVHRDRALNLRARPHN